MCRLHESGSLTDIGQESCESLLDMLDAAEELSDIDISQDTKSPLLDLISTKANKSVNGDIKPSIGGIR